ncbi:MAG: hypothetical protein J6S23_01935 [Clostridia bacterium]|nr:hypothetical protein [Clostridia bacterium]
MIEKLKEFLPPRIYTAIKQAQNNGQIEEIRIRKNRQAYIIQNGLNRYIDVIANESEILSILEKISHHSLYAYRETIANGYISLEEGIRIGLIGRASVENTNVVGIYEISEFAIRIPNKIKVNCKNIIDLAKSNSLLIYSPPGVGKTTLLRNLIYELSYSSNGKRIAVIDTRGELALGLENKSLLVSILSGYPRKLGIEIAVRTMNAQIIACDEIGDERDASAIIDAQGAGIPIIATCHGNSIKDILSHTGIKNLHKVRIFDYYVGITRNPNLEFNYSINTWEEANNDYF